MKFAGATFDINYKRIDQQSYDDACYYPVFIFCQHYHAIAEP
jgi:hypothetical protein